MLRCVYSSRRSIARAFAHALAIACLLSGLPAAAAGGDPTRPVTVETVFPTDDVVIAAFAVDPPREGPASARIQAAIDLVAHAGGGVVFLRAGEYRLDAPITVKETVTLRGDWLPVKHRGGRRGRTDFERPGKDVGTLLSVVHGKGEAEGTPAITIERGAGLREVTVWYPDQDPTAIAPYPWTVRTSPTKGTDNYTVMNCVLVNPYQAFKTGPEGNELHTVRNVYGTPLKTGIWIDSTTDIGRVIHVGFSPEWWAQSGLPGNPVEAEARGPLYAFLRSEATGIDMGRSDWEYLYDLDIYGYARGIHIRQGERGTTNCVVFGSRIRGCDTALQLDELNGIGLSATGCEFVGNVAVHATEKFKTVAQFNTCEFHGGLNPDFPGRGVLLEGKGALTFQNCAFTHHLALEAQSGRVSLLNCEWTYAGNSFGTGGPHAVFGKDVRRIRMLGNKFMGEALIENASENADCMISHSPIDSPRPDTSLPPDAPHPRPVNGLLFNVRDCGASPEAEDNTAAFQGALDKARDAKGGTVYVAGGNYRFTGSIVVPAGVELRGCFDVPHHTISGGSVLMPLAGRGDEDGTPFIQLEEGSGLRGLTVWYPEQNLMDVQPYPWAVRALGPKCWLMDVVFGNTYNGADFWTHPSDGHVIRYLCGAVLRRGLQVSKCRGDGWVEDIQFNPHYGLRLPGHLPRPKYPSEPFPAIIDQQRGHLDALVFGRCANEHLTRNFLYAAYDGIAFRDDDGGARARVIMHGTDTGSRAAVIESDAKIEFINAQLVPLGDYEVGSLIVGDSFTGKAKFFNSQVWAGNTTALVAGTGDILIQQMNTLSGGFTVSGGKCTIENVLFSRGLDPHIRVEPGCKKAVLRANISKPGALCVDNQAGDRVLQTAASCSFRTTAEVDRYSLAVSCDEPLNAAVVKIAEGGGIREVSDAVCATEKHKRGDAESQCIRLAGKADSADHSFVYFQVADSPVWVFPDTTLTYWIMPTNDRSRSSAVDIVFADGSTLRDSGMHDADGVPVHTGTSRGAVGEWRRVTVPIGQRHSGKAIKTVMVAYDSRSGKGPFETVFDDIVIESEEGPASYLVAASPRGSAEADRAEVTIEAPDGVGVRYTLDGSRPSAESAQYGEPIALKKRGLHELRYAAEKPSGGVSAVVYGELYDVR